jgi:hypothetical protein
MESLPVLSFSMANGGYYRMKTTAELLKEYKSLYDEGVLSDGEFESLKKQLLAKGNQKYQEKSDIEKRNAITNKSSDNNRVISAVSVGSSASNNSQMNTSSSPSTNTNAAPSTSNVDAGTWGCLIVVIAIIVIMLMGCSSLLSDSGGSSSGDYETYYQDDNGNGKLDRGEWNWTEDSDGNVVDIDNDGSNFE